MSESQELRKAMQQCDHCEGKPMTPENQSDEDLKKALDVFWEVQKIEQRLNFRHYRDAERCAKPIADALTSQRQSWEREKADLLDHLDDIYEEIDYSKARAEQTGDSPIDIIRDMKKEKAGLEERVRVLELELKKCNGQ